MCAEAVPSTGSSSPPPVSFGPLRSPSGPPTLPSAPERRAPPQFQRGRSRAADSGERNMGRSDLAHIEPSEAQRAGPGVGGGKQRGWSQGPLGAQRPDFVGIEVRSAGTNRGAWAHEAGAPWFGGPIPKHRRGGRATLERSLPRCQQGALRTGASRVRYGTQPSMLRAPPVRRAGVDRSGRPLRASCPAGGGASEGCRFIRPRSGARFFESGRDRHRNT